MQTKLLDIISMISDLVVIFFSWGGVWLSPLGTSATNWPIVPAPDDGWWVWSSRWNENWQGRLKYSEKTCPSATLSTTNPTWPDSGSNPGRRNGNPATNRLSYGAARVQARVWSCGICGRQSGAGAGLLRVLRFPLSIFIPPILHNHPHLSSGAYTIGQKWSQYLVDLVPPY
jgi:hypothetical protein